MRGEGAWELVSREGCSGARTWRVDLSLSRIDHRFCVLGEEFVCFLSVCVSDGV